MDFSSMPLFGAMKRRMSWLSQRQEVLAKNVANADTPGYQPRDLKAPDFKDMVSTSTPVNMAVTDGQHLAGRPARSGGYGEGKTYKPYETAPDGNAVVLEEQMAKVNETVIDHKLTNELYRKHLDLFKMVTRK